VIRSDSVSSAVPSNGNPNLVPVGDVLPLEFTQLEQQEVEGYLVSLTFDPDLAQPYQVRVEHEPVDECDNLKDAHRDFAFWVSEVFNNARYGEVQK
jgi:hypothetical protein